MGADDGGGAGLDGLAGERALPCLGRMLVFDAPVRREHHGIDIVAPGERFDDAEHPGLVLVAQQHLAVPVGQAVGAVGAAEPGDPPGLAVFRGFGDRIPGPLRLAAPARAGEFQAGSLNGVDGPLDADGIAVERMVVCGQQHVEARRFQRGQRPKDDS